MLSNKKVNSSVYVILIYSIRKRILNYIVIKINYRRQLIVENKFYNNTVYKKL